MCWSGLGLRQSGQLLSPTWCKTLWSCVCQLKRTVNAAWSSAPCWSLTTGTGGQWNSTATTVYSCSRKPSRDRVHPSCPSAEAVNQHAAGNGGDVREILTWYSHSKHSTNSLINMMLCVICVRCVKRKMEPLWEADGNAHLLCTFPTMTKEHYFFCLQMTSKFFCCWLKSRWPF